MEPKHPPAQSGSGWERLFFSPGTINPSKSRELLNSGSFRSVFVVGDPSLLGVRAINWLKVHGTLTSGNTGDPTSPRVLAWEPLRPLKYVAPPVKLTEEVSAAARELVEQLVPAKTPPEAARPHMAVNVAKTSSALPEEFLVSGKIVDFVLRGIQATSEIASRQFAADERWAALADLLPPQDLSTPLLRQAITRRIRRMFRSLASEAREDRSQMRLLASTSSWSIDVQYEIIERLPIRPDETSEFLRVLLLDIWTALKSGVRIGGGWGQLRIGAEGKLMLAVAPRRELEEPALASTPVRFTRIRRDANSAPP
jgi:hypothetical protein